MTIDPDTWLGLAAAYPAMRGALFGGFLSLGGLLLTALNFITTRIHDFMRTDSAKRRRMEVHEIQEGTPYTLHIRRRAQETQLAVTICFVVALLQVSIGLVNEPWARVTCVASVWIGASLVALYAWRTIRMYSVNLEQFDIDLQDEVHEAAKREAAQRHAS